MSEWSDNNRVLSSEGSAEAGQWNTSRAEYQRGMMDAVNEPGVKVIAIETSSQVGKTELLNNVLGYFMENQPSPILVIQPTLDMAETWSNDRLSPMIRDTPCLSKIFSSVRKASNKVRHKQFPGGHVTTLGANAPSGLASRPIRILLADEVDRYPLSAGEEGDPITLAMARLKTFWNSIAILTSTPTNENSRIHKAYLEGDQRRFFCPCPHCEQKQIIEWKNIQIPKNDDTGEYDFQDVYLVCENGCVIDKKYQAWMVKHGEWIATTESKRKGTISFHINELYSPWVTWEETARDFIAKKREGRESLRTFINTSLGEIFRDGGDGATTTLEQLMERRQNYGVPDGTLFLTAAVDNQKDRQEVLVQAWMEGQQRFDVEHHTIWGNPVKDERVWDDLDEYLTRTFEGHRITCAVIDEGGVEGVTDATYNFCKPRSGRRIFPVKGSSKYYAPAVSPPRQVGKQRVMHYELGTDTIKDWVLLNWIGETDPQILNFNHWADEEFFRQLMAEERQLINKNGIITYKWKPIRQRNEILDLYVMNTAAYHILNPNIELLVAKRDSTPEPEQKTDDEIETPSTLKRYRPTRRKPNWMTGV